MFFKPIIKIIQNKELDESLNSKRKIQAFTLGELLVVLVISSIVVTLAFLMLSNVRRQVKSINNTFDTQQKVIKLERLLMLDLNTRNASYDSQKKRIVFCVCFLITCTK